MAQELGLPPSLMLLPLLLLLILCLEAQHPSLAASITQNASMWQLVRPSGGGYCLDGSEPSYYFRQGQASGTSKWILHLMGGGWCFTWDNCLSRSRTTLGSSNSLPIAPLGSWAWQGLTSSNRTDKPDFWNWNVAIIIINYCDGGSYLGQRGTTKLNNSSLVFSGRSGVEQLIQDMKKTQGLDQASAVLLTGCSAGGYSVAVQCGWLAQQLPPAARVKCLVDAGFFLDVNDQKDQPFFRNSLQHLSDLHGTSASVPAACLSEASTQPWECLLPENSITYMKTQLMVVNSLYDFMALNIVYNDYNKTLNSQLVMRCIRTGNGCTPKARQAFKSYGAKMDKTLKRLSKTKAKGSIQWTLLNGADHCLTTSSLTWSGPVSQAVAKWFSKT